VLAEVQGSRRTPYKVRVRVRPFTTAEWERLLDVFAAEIGHTAALLDGELPPGVADDVRSAGLDLLPGPGELQPRCSCPDWADPCKHAAAVCYLVADELDADAFGVLLLRGLGREEVLAGLRARRRSAAPAAAGAIVTLAEERDEGVPARGAWSRSRPALPSAPDLPRRPGRPAALAADPPAELGVDVAVLRDLAGDAAARALRAVRDGAPCGLELSFDEDVARRAAELLDAEGAPRRPDGLAELARRSSLTPREMLAKALAYRDGGAPRLAALDEAWDPGADLLAPGRDLLGPGAVARRNRVTLRDRQFRLARDGLWYPFRKDGASTWLPDGAPVDLARGEADLGDLGDLGDLDDPARSAGSGSAAPHDSTLRRKLRSPRPRKSAQKPRSTG
jgi:hypothetical protein